MKGDMEKRRERVVEEKYVNKCQFSYLIILEKYYFDFDRSEIEESKLERL